MNTKEQLLNEMSKDFNRILDDYRDPIEIERKRIKQLRENKIKEIKEQLTI
jgi:hypothetical protein